MIDLIFFTFFVGLFYAGFVCGHRYGTVKAMLSAWHKKLAGLFD